MQKTLTEKLLTNNLLVGKTTKNKEIGIKIDQTLTQDATGTMACLQFELLNIKKIKTEMSINYIDHNTLQTGFENADDHVFLQSFSEKYGLYYSRAGNGICHQIHLERFAKPGKILLGSDSHTPTAGGVGMLAIGAGGLNIATSMAGEPFYLKFPEIINIKLKGKLNFHVSAKDIILYILKKLSVRGAINKIIEYSGTGIKYLTIPERATITNMGAELGATTSIFPSDSITKNFLISQKREEDFIKLNADKNAKYDKTIEIDLSLLEPLCAKPHSPDNVSKVSEIKNLKINQVIIGSCTNSSYLDLMKAANILKNKTIHPSVSLSIAPGSKQVLEMIAQNGALQNLISSGARILESACGPCIGMGQAPKNKGVSLRTFNRNFEGRSGTKNADIYLVSPETAAASSISGVLTDPRKIRNNYKINVPRVFLINDNMIIKPKKNNKKINIIRGPNIKPIPSNKPLSSSLKGKVILKTKENITTDQIIPAGTKILPLRSNIPEISKYCFKNLKNNFSEKALKEKMSFIISGHNYGQGSSREHAALIPMYLGIKCIIAKSFARIHKTNLINFGIIPLLFKYEKDYNKINEEDYLLIKNIKINLLNQKPITIFNKTKNIFFETEYDLSDREIQVIISGGLINHIKKQKKRNKNDY